MANPVWGMLEKSLVDSEKIEPAIDRLIAVHEADPDSHLAVGESLQSHKASEIIDHLAESIIEDKFASGSVSSRAITADQIVGKDIRTAADVGAGVDGVKMVVGGIEMWQGGEKKVDIPVSGDPFFAGDVALGSLSFLREVIMPIFESIDGWVTSISGSVSVIQPWVGYLNLTAGEASDAYVILNLEPGAYRGMYDPTKDPFFEVGFHSADIGLYSEFIIQMGGYLTSSFAREGQGFYYDGVNDILYASYDKAVDGQTLVELTLPNMLYWHKYRVESFSSGTILKFYIDDVLVLTKTDGAGADNDYRFSMGLRNKSANDFVQSGVRNLIFSQKY